MAKAQLSFTADLVVREFAGDSDTPFDTCVEFLVISALEELYPSLMLADERKILRIFLKQIREMHHGLPRDRELRGVQLPF